MASAALGKPPWRCWPTDLEYSDISITDMNLLQRKPPTKQWTDKPMNQSMTNRWAAHVQSKVRLELAAEAKPAGFRSSRALLWCGWMRSQRFAEAFGRISFFNEYPWINYDQMGCCWKGGFGSNGRSVFFLNTSFTLQRTHLNNATNLAPYVQPSPTNRHDQHWAINHLLVTTWRPELCPQLLCSEQPGWAFRLTHACGEWWLMMLDDLHMLLVVNYA